MVPVDVEIADNLLTRALGLMFRTSIAKNSGMLFVFDNEDYRSLWMLFTFIPLEALIIAEKYKKCKKFMIAEIMRLKPHDIKPKRTSVKTKYILEVPQGFSNRNNIKIGNIVYIS
jgi:uncharacterized membrane protein (UPF0127 family)